MIILFSGRIYRVSGILLLLNYFCIWCWRLGVRLCWFVCKFMKDGFKDSG